MITEWNIEDVLDLPSVDSDDFWRTRANRRETVRESVHNEHVMGRYHEQIKAQMAQDGINAVPIHIGYGEEMDVYLDDDTQIPARHYGMLVQGNGHHRIMIALELGHTRMRVTDDHAESGVTMSGIYELADLLPVDSYATV